MLNQCTLTGNLDADPEIFYSSQGDPVATFNLAFHSSKKKTNWIKVTCFHKLAEVVQKYLHKGARIAVIATLDQSRWETDVSSMLGDLFQSLTDRRIKILLTTLAAYPGGYTINIDRLTFEMKPGSV